MSYITNKLRKWSEEGVRLPYAFDGSTGEPSITLLFAYLSFFLCMGSAVALHFKPELLQASIFTLAFWVIAFVFYRMRRLDSVKIDLDDKSIELEGKDEQNP